MVNLTNLSGNIIFWLDDAKILRHEINMLSLDKLLDIISFLPILPTLTFYTKITIEIDGIVKQIYPQ
jgi:hypothetical protein